MDEFEAYMQKATARGSNIVPGAVVAVVDKDGRFIYKNAFGYNGTATDDQPLSFDATFFIASCTKLITSISALQLVEHGIITLDEPLDAHLPELTAQPILSRSSTGELKLTKATESITLRQLITHSSGATYDWLAPELYEWKASQGLPAPTLVVDCDVAKGYAYPRTFEAGQGFNYSGGHDWTSLLIERLTNTRFGEYVKDNIAKPLGIKSFVWQLAKNPNVEKRLAKISARAEDGTLGAGPTPFWADPPREAGGAGLYSDVHDYTRVLADLLKDTPVLLKKQTVDDMFSPQFPEGSPALKSLVDVGPAAYACSLDDSMESVKPNFGLGSLLLMEDVERKDYFKPKGTLTWTGLPNLLWSVNRERGMALFFAQQVLPWADRKAFEVVARFETAVWRNLKA